MENLVMLKRSVVILFSTLYIVVQACSNTTDYKVSDHFDGTRFFNPGVENKKSFFDFLRWQFLDTWVEWPEIVEERAEKPQICEPKEQDTLCVTFIGHATVLIQHKGISYLTDPIWSQRASPVSWAGPKRHRQPGVPFTMLPKIDYVLISHNHYDHLDIPTLKRLNEVHAPQFLVPLGDAKLLKDEGIQRVTELDWAGSIRLSMEQVITFERAQHWSKRSLFDTRKSLWGSYVVRSFGKSVFFAGDTGYGDFFKDIGTRNAGFDLSLIPIGAYEPRDFMKSHHVNPEDSVKIHQDLKSRKSVGVHFGTFRLTSEGIEDPVTALGEALKAANLKETDFFAPRMGQTLKLL
jgi:L-ascorbate metabolism protein UlaG (beta-lactamase superfamily)